MTTKKYTGIWHLPPDKDETKTQSYHGLLTISELGKISLEFTLPREVVEEELLEVNQNLHRINSQIPIPIIHAKVKDSESMNDVDFTLTDLLLVAYSQSGLTRIVLEAAHAITNFNPCHGNPLNFQNTMVKIDGIDSWLNVNGFEINGSKHTKKFSTKIEFQQPEPIEVLKTSNDNIYFYFRANSPMFADSNEVTIKQSIYLNWETETPHTISDSITFAEKIQNFFTFISFGSRKRLGHELRQLKGKYNPKKPGTYLNHELFYPEKFSKSKEGFDQEQFDFIFKYKNFEERSIQAVVKWLEIYDKYKIAFDQYFDMKYAASSHHTSRLITLTSILEILYVKYFNDDPRDLARKLNHLIQNKSTVFDLLPISRDNLIEKIVAVRKYFVHGTQSRQHFDSINTTSKRLILINLQLENIFRVYILSELEISDQEIIEFINRKTWLWGVNTFSD